MKEYFIKVVHPIFSFDEVGMIVKAHWANNRWNVYQKDLPESDTKTFYDKFPLFNETYEWHYHPNNVEVLDEVKTKNEKEKKRMNKTERGEIYSVVEKVLTNCPEARDNDNIMYLEVLKEFGGKYGIDINRMPVSTFLTSLEYIPLPTARTTERMRRKLQEQNPKLRASAGVQAERKVAQRECKEYWSGNIFED